MKKILFVCSSLKVGGAEKSLVNLLNLMDYKQYDVDLLLLQNQGGFLEQVPEQVHIIRGGQNMQALYDTVPFSLRNMCMKGIKYLSTIYEKLLWKEYDVLRVHRWLDFYSRFVENLNKNYDVAIAYLSGDTSYFVVDKVTAKRKVTFYHTDISNIKIDTKAEEPFMKAVDLIVTISDKCVKSIYKQFPQYTEKIVCLQNLTSSEFIKQLAKEYQPKEYGKDAGAKILSVGRLVKLKGYDMAIDAAKLLIQRGHSVQWYVVGEGPERVELEKRISKNGLQDVFHLVGIRTNPYPYMYHADIVVQPSRYEGKSVVLDEAKIFAKPIVVTRYSSVEDQVDDGQTGLIADMTAEGLANQIEVILTDNKKKESLVNCLIQMLDDPVAEVGNYCRVLMGE